jgi:putative Mn2+ efflux pump MntP
LDIPTLLIAFSLAMDAFSVSITHGLANQSVKLTTALTLGVSFGSFQAIMPILGWLAGVSIIDVISAFDHWIAFGLLCVVGGRMIYEATKKGSDRLITSLSIGTLLLLSVATSIDALAVGMSLSFLNVAILTPSLVIGVVTFSLSCVGVYLGNRFGRFLGNKVEVLGGILLLAIGLRVLIEHMA